MFFFFSWLIFYPAVPDILFILFSSTKYAKSLGLKKVIASTWVRLKVIKIERIPHTAGVHFRIFMLFLLPGEWQVYLWHECNWNLFCHNFCYFWQKLRQNNVGLHVYPAFHTGLLYFNPIRGCLYQVILFTVAKDAIPPDPVSYHHIWWYETGSGFVHYHCF